jgi:hypothetical protein
MNIAMRQCQSFPELTYEGMAVANGQDAGLARESLVRGTMDQDIKTSAKGLGRQCWSVGRTRSH